MMRWLLLGVVFLAGCAGGPPAPDWQANAHAALNAHVQAFLTGRDRVAAQELTIAQREVARTGHAEQVARVELTACAVRHASLDGGECTAYLPLAQDAGPAARAYADYLAGRWQGLDAALLPPAQRGVSGAGSDDAILQAIDDPLSCLVAAAALLHAGRLSPAGIAIAIDTASAQGWRRPLLAWLGFDRDRLAAAGDAAGAAERQRRMDIVTATLGQ